MFETKTYDLTVTGIVKVNGLCLFKTKPSVFDIQGRVSPKTLTNDTTMFMIDRGSYIVLFNEEGFPEFNSCVSFEVKQNDLHKGGLHLSVSADPFEGFMIAGYSSQIELGAKIASIVFTMSKDMVDD